MSNAYRNIARVARPHGKHGEVIVQPVRGLPFLLEPGMEVALTPPALDRDRFCNVDAVWDDGRVRFSGIDSLNDAESISGCFVLAHSEDIVLDALTVAFDDLIGRAVVDVRFGELGEVSGVIETPANDVLQVEGPYGEVLVPVIEQALDEIPQTGSIETHIMDGLISERALSGAQFGHDEVKGEGR